jgi:hypothetical protein
MTFACRSACSLLTVLRPDWCVVQVPTTKGGIAGSWCVPCVAAPHARLACDTTTPFIMSSKWDGGKTVHVVQKPDAETEADRVTPSPFIPADSWIFHFYSVADPECFYPGSKFFHPGSDPGFRVKKIPDPGSGSASKNLSIFHPKTEIWNVHPGYRIRVFFSSRIPDPDPWVKKAPDPETLHF